MADPVAQSIVDEVQAAADATQSEAYRFEVRGDKVYEVRAWPNPRSAGGRPPVPTPDAEGTLHDGDDGKVLRCRALAVRLTDDGRVAERRDSLLEAVDPEEDPEGRSHRLVEGFHVEPVEREDETLAPPPELADWAGGSRRRGLRLYEQGWVPVEFEWAEDPEAVVGREPVVRERDDVDVE